MKNEILSEEANHYISRIKIEDEFKLNFEMQSFVRVYYFIKGTGIIDIDGIKYEINQGNCFLVNKL